MSLNDPIADMLTRLRNAVRAHKQVVSMPSSRKKLAVLRIMHGEGFIGEVKTAEDGGHKVLSVALKYGEADEPVINDIVMVSKPSLRIYAGWQKLPRVRDGLGIAIISTSQGMMTAESARDTKVGGEIICKMW
jgi:small subunit ribosomal protein S8